MAGPKDPKKPRRASRLPSDKIGTRNLAPSTMMMGFGYDPMLSEGSLKPPIFLTSTFVFENAAAGKRFFEGVTGKRPGMMDFVGRAKYDAWAALEGSSMEDAEAEYIETVDSLVAAG